nr:HAMP domain-containing sensor histidine kinase [Spirochaetales bacterium]
MGIKHKERLIEAGLLMLLCILLAVSVLLNRKQYSTSLSTVEFNFQRSLDLQSGALRRQIELQEAEGFRRVQTDPLLELNLFLVSETNVVPVCTAPLLDGVSAQTADEAFENGIELLPDVRAFPYFEIAARRSVENSEDLYRKIAAFFNLLELEPDVQTTCCILTLLNQNTPSLSASQELFFRNMLNEQVENSAELEHQLNVLWKTAQMIDQNLTRKKGAYRVPINGQVLTISEDGLALLYHPDIKVDAPMQLTEFEEENLCQEVIPGLYTAIPAAVIDQAKSTVRQQYVTGNGIIALLVLLLSILGVGLQSARKRQRQLETARTEFIATVSHELRTPLSLIRLHAETLAHGRVSEQRIADYHQTILTEAERLTGIVNNVLDFSRIERNQLRIHPESTNLSTLCDQIVESFQSRLEKEGFLLESRIVSD